MQIYLGYEGGVAKPSASSGTPVHGQLVSERVKGVLVLELWPFDFPLNTKASTTVKPLHSLWHPRVSVFLATQFGVSGMERVPAGRGWRWVAQRWLCQPRSFQDIMNELHAAESGRPHEVPQRAGADNEHYPGRSTGLGIQR